MTSNEVTKGGLTIQALSDKNEKASPRVDDKNIKIKKAITRNKVKELRNQY